MVLGGVPIPPFGLRYRFELYASIGTCGGGVPVLGQRVHCVLLHAMGGEQSGNQPSLLHPGCSTTKLQHAWAPYSEAPVASWNLWACEGFVGDLYVWLQYYTILSLSSLANWLFTFAALCTARCTSSLLVQGNLWTARNMYGRVAGKCFSAPSAPFYPSTWDAVDELSMGSSSLWASYLLHDMEIVFLVYEKRNQTSISRIRTREGLSQVLSL